MEMVKIGHDDSFALKAHFFAKKYKRISFGSYLVRIIFLEKGGNRAIIDLASISVRDHSIGIRKNYKSNEI
jgi:hypothetical protein